MGNYNVIACVVGWVVLASVAAAVGWMIGYFCVLYMTRATAFYFLCVRANKFHGLPGDKLSVLKVAFFGIGRKLALMGDSDSFSNQYIFYSPTKRFVKGVLRRTKNGDLYKRDVTAAVRKVLTEKGSSKAAKTAAGSALSQRPGGHKRKGR